MTKSLIVHAVLFCLMAILLGLSLSCVKRKLGGVECLRSCFVRVLSLKPAADHRR